MNTRALLLLVIFTFVAGCGSKGQKVIRVVDRQNMKILVLTGERTKLTNFYDADIVIIGGGVGGIAAAIAACSSGRSTILIEETDSIAGCFSKPDTSRYFDNRFMEMSGSSLRYRTFREKIKEWYEKKSKEQPKFISTLFSDIEDFGTDNFCFESEAAVDIIYDMVENHLERERLIILKRHKIAEVVSYSKRIASLNVVDLDNKVVNQVTGWMFIDATETGDILPLAGIEYVTGREGKADTGEPHAPETADSLNATEFYYYRDVDKSDGSDYYEIDLLKDKPKNVESFSSVKLVKESRRIKAIAKIIEQDISEEFRKGPRARFFGDSVGIGYSPIVISQPGMEEERIAIETKPFQIPLSSLIPGKYTNFISAGRTLGTTYITNSAYSAPSVEWGVGEGAGEVAAFCAGHNIITHELLNSESNIKSLREWIVNRGIPVYWYDDVSPDDPDFSEAQMKPFDDPDYHESAKTLHFRK